jgi:YbbR domain-containing protein
VRRWVWDNLESLLFAFLLAVAVWLAGVSATDPIEERVFATPIPIQYLPPADGLIVVGTPPADARVTLRAPQSVWQRLSVSDLRLMADLSLLQAGTQTVVLEASVQLAGVRVMRVQPERVVVALERASRQTVSVRALMLGEPASRYLADAPEVEPGEVEAIGPASLVGTVVEAVAAVDMTGADRDLDQVVDLVPRNASGEVVAGVLLEPATARVRIHVSLPGGFRSVAVLPTLTEQVEPGYRVTNVTVTPPTVVVFSSNSQAIEALPGFLQTRPISLAGADDTFQQRASIDLPLGISLVDEQTVLVEVTIEPILSSITLTRQVEIVGLEDTRFALASPQMVSVILDGPLPVLERLQPDDVRVVADLLGLGLGEHTVEPEVIVLPQGVSVRRVIPGSLEVTISSTPLVTPTPLP